MDYPRIGSEPLTEIDTSVKNRITINVGGVRHETFLSTLANIPDTRLSWLTESSAAFYDPIKKEYFFDRHPGVFAQVLNYYRTGKLHCPTDICGPLFEEELNFWGIDEKQMEPCCWANYTQHREAELNLKAFVGPGFEDSMEDENNAPESCGSKDRFFNFWHRVRPKIWRFLDEPYSSKRARYLSYLSCLFIAVSVITFCVTTIPGVRDQGRLIGTDERHSVLTEIELACTIFFTIEFVARLLLCPSKVYFIKQPMNWIDFMAIWPFFVYYLTGKQAFQMLLVVRVLRLFRFVKLSYGLQIIIQTLRASVEELLLLLLILLIPVILFSSIVYYVENLMINNKTNFNENLMIHNKTNFNSVPASIWWCLITMTTVGYGDITPDTWGGKIVGGIVAICGILIVALPISVIGSNFNLFYAHAQARLKLPVKQQRLVLGGVPGLISKHHELSSRRIVKKRATIFEHGDQLDMETNWLSSEKVFGIAEGAEPSEAGTDNEREASRMPLLSPNTAANRKLCGDEIFSVGELNRLNRYKMKRPRRTALMTTTKLKEDAKRDSAANMRSSTNSLEGSLKVSFPKEEKVGKYNSDDSLVTLSTHGSSSSVLENRTRRKRKNSNDTFSLSTNPDQAEMISEATGAEIPSIHLTANKAWGISRSSSSDSVTAHAPQSPSISSSTNSIKGSQSNLGVYSPPLWRRTSISDSQLSKPYLNDKNNTNQSKDGGKDTEHNGQLRCVDPVHKQRSLNGLTFGQNQGITVGNGGCLQNCDGATNLTGRVRASSQPCPIPHRAKAKTVGRNTESVLETNI